VSRAAGRALSDAEVKAIDDRMDATMRRLAQADPEGWRGKAIDQRVSEAATAAMQDLQAAAARKLANAQRQVVATAATQQRIANLAAQHADRGASHALVADIENTQLYVEGVKRAAVSELMDLVDAATSTQGATIGRKVLQFLFDAQNPDMTRDLVAEIFGNGKAGTGNAIARAGAEAWLKTIEGMRTRFNAAGGDVGKLAYGYLPQAHDSARIRQAGAQKWAAQTLGLLDRRRYVREDGSRMNDGEVLQLLTAAHETLASDGLSKQVPGAFKGSGARANRGMDSRVLHFKDGESFLQYNRAYGLGSMYDAMVAHVGGMARDIALIERYGPNPNQQFRLQNDIAAQADQGGKRVFGNKAEAYWDILTGVTSTPESARIALVGQTTRNIQTFGKLAGAVISSLTDLGSIMVTTGYNKLPYWDLLRNTIKGGTKEGKEFAAAHGLIAESMINDLNRWAGENIRNDWSGRLANSTMRLSLMNAWTDTLRRGFSMTMQQGLGRLAGKKWADLTEWDRTHLQRKGIEEVDWEVVNAAQLTPYNGSQFLTPEAIAASGHPRANEVTAKVLGFITDESEYAVINPDMATKAIQSWGGEQTGTIKGELARAVMQFKSFPIAMISRHWRRMLDAPQVEGAPVLGNKLAYSAAMIISTTALGAIVFQVKQMLQGKDPVDMTKPKFWVRASAQGGGAGFVGDILLGDTTDSRSPLDNLGKLALGPTFGSLADLYELTKGNADEALAGKDTHMGAEALRFGRSHLPLINLWYGRAALDHMLLHGVQENLSPGYLARQRQRAAKDWGQGYWWEPGDAAPDRAPDLSAIGGK
jgi:hypothetical protein